MLMVENESCRYVDPQRKNRKNVSGDIDKLICDIDEIARLQKEIFDFIAKNAIVTRR